MLAKTIMVQGTGSDVGKSVVATAICRLLKRRGFRVAPFKAQNMSNNSYVTAGGGEIGRAQAVQAEACGIEPTVFMNPILLKPNTDKTSQVIVMGKVFDTLEAKDYYQRRQILMERAHEALNQLRQDYDIVVIEGAGSPAEVNIKDKDIVNMSVAKAVKSPVILVGDIDKGGVFAQIVGTFDLFDEEEKNLVKTFIINKFRGDKDLFISGLEWIENKIQRKSLGVLPMFPNLDIEQEDAVVLEKKKGFQHRSYPKTSIASSGWRGQSSEREDPHRAEGPANDWMRQDPRTNLLVHVIRLPRISNFTDFDHLNKEQDIMLDFIERPDRNIIPDLLIIPGTKNTISDLDFLKRTGFGEHIQRCLRAGSSVLGICGGYQMLGQAIEDPYAVESNTKVTEGLQLIPMTTAFSKEKITVQVKGVHVESQLPVEGYEIHMGQTHYLNKAEPFFQIIEREGKPAEGGEGYHRDCIWGTYIHGLFEKDDFRRYFINKIRVSASLFPIESFENTELNEASPYDRLANEFEKHMDMKVLEEILDLEKTYAN